MQCSLHGNLGLTMWKLVLLYAFSIILIYWFLFPSLHCYFWQYIWIKRNLLFCALLFYYLYLSCMVLPRWICKCSMHGCRYLVVFTCIAWSDFYLRIRQFYVIMPSKFQYISLVFLLRYDPYVQHFDSIVTMYKLALNTLWLTHFNHFALDLVAYLF